MSVRRVLVLSAVTCVTSLTLVTPGPAGAVGSPAAAVPASVCFPSTDNGDPSLLTLRLGRAVVDVRTGALSIAVTATAVDSGGPGAPSGVREATLYVQPGKNEAATNIPRVRLLPAGDGTLAGTVRIPKGTYKGAHPVSVWLYDRAGNQTPYSAAALAGLGLPSSVMAGSRRDRTAPKMTGLTLSSATVDTRRGAKTVTVTTRLIDDYSGVHEVQAWLGQYETNLRRVRGGPRHGTWSGEVTVPQWRTKAGADLTLFLEDRVGRSAKYSTGRLKRAGFPSHVRIISLIDKSKPTVSITSAAPLSLDVRQTDGAVTFTARAQDAGSGVRSVHVIMDRDRGGYQSRPMRLTRVAGSARDGRWRATVPLTKCATAAGNWSVTLWAVDRTGHTSYAKNTPTFTIVADDITRPSADVGFPNRISVNGPVTVVFGEDVVGLSSDTMSMRQGTSMRGVDLSSQPVVAGTWSCRTGTGIAADCMTGPVREASFTPDKPFVYMSSYSPVLNPEHQLGLTDLSGNPAEPGSLYGFYAGLRSEQPAPGSASTGDNP